VVVFHTEGILSDALSLYFSSFVPFTLLVGVILLPAFIVQLLAESRSADDPRALTASLLSAVFQLLLTYVANAAMVYGVFQTLRGRPTGVGECLVVGFRRMLPAFGVALAVGLIVLVGMLLLCIPGLIAQAAFYVALPVAVIERVGVGGSLRRSAELTTGFRWRVFFIALGLGLIGMLFGGLIGAAAALALPPAGAAFVGWGVQVVFNALSAVASSLVYFKLRQIKESVVDVETIAAVFD
jgi:hypothetical protein